MQPKEVTAHSLSSLAKSSVSPVCTSTLEFVRIVMLAGVLQKVCFQWLKTLLCVNKWQNTENDTLWKIPMHVWTMLRSVRLFVNNSSWIFDENNCLVWLAATERQTWTPYRCNHTTKNLLTFSGSTPMSSQNFSMPSGPTTSSQPVTDRHSVKPHITSFALA